MTQEHDANESPEFLLGDFWFGKLFHFEVYGDHPTEPTTVDMYAEADGAFFHILTLWNVDQLGKGTTLRPEWLEESGFAPRSPVSSLLYGETIGILQRLRKRQLQATPVKAA